MDRKKGIADAWNADSDAYFARVDYEMLFHRLKTDPYAGFPQAIAALIKKTCPDLRGKKVLVPSCGDNVAVLGLCALGAEVTATDIAMRQIQNARRIAEDWGQNVTYLCVDSMTLSGLADNAYDFIYTSNGVHVWIDDLMALYKSFFRVLKPGGRYVFFDTHPFSRPFDNALQEGLFKAIKPYEDIGPFHEDPTYAWRIQDFVNALTGSGFTLTQMLEFNSTPQDFAEHNYFYHNGAAESDRYDWRQNPWAALPQCLGLSVYKP